MSEPLAVPTKYKAALDRTEDRLKGLEISMTAGSIQPTPEQFAVVLRHTAGIVQALAGCLPPTANPLTT